MGELKETPIKRPWAKSVSNALRSARDFANKASIPDAVPLIGGEPVGDFLLGQTPEGFDRVSYGEPMTTGRGWTTKLRPEAVDMVFTGMDVAPVANGVTKLLRKGADAASTAAVRRITGNAAATPHGVIDEAVQMSPLSQIFAGRKSKGADLDALERAKIGLSKPVDFMTHEGEKWSDANANWYAKIDEPIDSDLSRKVYQDTGWFRGPDEKWRYEIDDRPAFTANSLTPKINKARGEWAEAQAGANQYADGLRSNVLYGALDKENADLLWQDRRAEVAPLREKLKSIVDTQGEMYKIGSTRRTSDLTSFLRHPELQEAYPDMKFLTAEPFINSGMAHNKEGYYLPSKGHIGMAGKTEADVRQGLLHELQHYVQGQEGFARGGSQDEFAMPELLEKQKAESRISTLNQIMSRANSEGNAEEYARAMAERDALVPLANKDEADIISRGYESYRRLAGEAESRAVEKRKGYTPSQRRKTFPLDDYDVPLNELIFKEQK